MFESLFRLIEWQVIVYDQLGVAPQRSGNQLAVAPGAVINTYLTADNDWLTVTSGTPRSVRNVATLLDLPAEDYVTVEQQLAHRKDLDDGLREWISRRSTDECLSEMKLREVVASRIFTVADIVDDQTYRERGDIISIDDPELGAVRMQGVVPYFAGHPGAVWRTGPSLGQDNQLVYREYLGLTVDEYSKMSEGGTI